MKLRIASLTILCLALGIPALAQTWTYDNGPVNGTVNAWAINFGYITTDTFVAGGNAAVSGFSFYVWELGGDTALSAQWSITAFPFGVPPNALGNSVPYGSGTASGANLTDTFISTNQYDYDIDLITITGLNVQLTPGSRYWLNLQNAVTLEGEPLYWDENDGVGCGGVNGTGQGCPSLAAQLQVGTIPSESFTVTGGSQLGPAGTTPEPSSILLFGSGVLGLVGLLRQKLF